MKREIRSNVDSGLGSLKRNDKSNPVPMSV